MSNAKEIKRKITSIENTWKITKAMELISTVKMKKAQELALEKKDFVVEVLKIFLKLGDFFKDFPFFKKKWKWKTLWIVITSNKWLCWGYNINVMKKVNEYVNTHWDEEMDYITVWKKAALFIVKTGNNLIADFSQDFSDIVDPLFTKNITSVIYESFLSWKYNKVVVFYNYYVNSIKQIPMARGFLPIDDERIKRYLKNIAGEGFNLEEEQKIISEKDLEYIIEPSIDTIALKVVPMILDMMFYDIVIEAKASEHSARMMAMKSAKDNAKKIAWALTLKYNNARQAMITKEVSEIVAWVESLKDM